MSTTLEVLMIVTSHAVMGSSGAPTGVWFEELATPYYAFLDAGAKVDIASVNGGVIPIDPSSMGDNEEQAASVKRFLQDADAVEKMNDSIALDTAQVEPYGIVFLPGGHGTMWDFPENESLATVLSKAWAEEKVVAAVCHGPAGLINVKDSAGLPLLKGKRVSAFSNAEETQAGLTGVVPFALETRIRDLGAQYESGPDFAAFAVADGRLVTGQNPASSSRVADLALKAYADTQ